MRKDIQMGNDIDKLKKQIAELTGKTPKSSNPRYLAQRLALLEEMIKAGENVKHESRGSSVVAISLSTAGAEALERIKEKTKQGATDICRAALASWAKAHGFSKYAEALAS